VSAPDAFFAARADGNHRVGHEHADPHQGGI
jgi:hypothetical protein